jgi:hypothetical protein
MMSALSAEGRRRRPVAIAAMAGVLVALGSAMLVISLFPLLVAIRTQIVIHPFHHVISFFLNRWELSAVFVVFGFWFVLTGRGLWKLRPHARISGLCIFGLLLLRGLLALTPPLEPGDVTIAASLIVTGAAGMIVLRRFAAGFAM